MEEIRVSSKFGLLAVASVLVLAVCFSGCGAVYSTPANTPSGVSIALTAAPPSTIAPSGTTTIAATVSNDSTNAGVDWSCSPSGSCGSFSSAQTASGATTTFTAPAAGGSVTITATSTSYHAAAASATITVSSSGTLSMSMTGAPSITVSALSRDTCPSDRRLRFVRSRFFLFLPGIFSFARPRLAS